MMIASPESLRILDTDHISLHQRGHAGITANVASLPPEAIAVTIISLEESMRGWLAFTSPDRLPSRKMRLKARSPDERSEP